MISGTGVLLVLCIGLIFAEVSGESTQSFKDAVTPLAKDCQSEVGATDEDVNDVINRNSLQKQSAKCLLSCVYTKLGAIKEGKLVKEDATMPIMDRLYGFREFKTVMRTQVVHNCIVETEEQHTDLCDLAKHFLDCVLQHY